MHTVFWLPLLHILVRGVSTPDSHPASLASRMGNPPLPERILGKAQLLIWTTREMAALQIAVGGRDRSVSVARSRRDTLRSRNRLLLRFSVNSISHGDHTTRGGRTGRLARRTSDCAVRCTETITVEGVDVPLGMVSETLPGGGACAVAKARCLLAHFLLVHV